MNNKVLLKTAKISGWLLLILLIFYFTSGYAMVHKYGMSQLMSRSHARHLHEYMAIPFFILLFLHIVPYYIVKKQLKRLLVILAVIILFSIGIIFFIGQF